MSASERPSRTTGFALTCWAMFAPLAGAQEVLPFPPTPSASIAGRTMQESVYKPRVEPRLVRAITCARTSQQPLKARHDLGGLDVLGSPKTDHRSHAGWAWAGSAPDQTTTLVASHGGSTHHPMAVRWPATIQPDATPRPQLHHVNDPVSTLDAGLGITPRAW